MIEIKFSRQRLTGQEKERYAHIVKKIITQIERFNKSSGFVKDVVLTELKIIFK